MRTLMLVAALLIGAGPVSAQTYFLSNSWAAAERGAGLVGDGSTIYAVGAIVTRYDPSGSVLAAWGPPPGKLVGFDATSNLEFAIPHDSSTTIVTTTPQGTFLSSREFPRGFLNDGGAGAVDPDGNVYATVGQGYAEIVKYRPDGGEVWRAGVFETGGLDGFGGGFVFGSDGDESHLEVSSFSYADASGPGVNGRYCDTGRTCYVPGAHATDYAGGFFVSANWGAGYDPNATTSTIDRYNSAGQLVARFNHSLAYSLSSDVQGSVYVLAGGVIERWQPYSVTSSRRTSLGSILTRWR